MVLSEDTWDVPHVHKCDLKLVNFGDGHRKQPKSPFLARVISVQSIDTKGDFRATFYEMALLFLFSLFWLPLSGFRPFSFYKMYMHLKTAHFNNLKGAPGVTNLSIKVF